MLIRNKKYNALILYLTTVISNDIFCAVSGRSGSGESRTRYGASLPHRRRGQVTGRLSSIVRDVGKILEI